MPLTGSVKLVPEGSKWYIVTQDSSDAAIVEELKFIEDYMRSVAPSNEGFLDSHVRPHNNIVKFIVAVGQVAQASEAAGSRDLQKKCEEYFTYLSSKCNEFDVNPISEWLDGIRFGRTDVGEGQRVLQDVITETIDHLSSFVRERAPQPSGEINQSNGERPAGETTLSDMDRFFNYLPECVGSLRTEAELQIIVPWFFRSLEIAGDVCEFGCYQGTMSIKLAFVLKALNQNKTVYAFDTFSGFLMDDPSGGVLHTGAYGDKATAFDELTKWSAVLPVMPVKGDARETCKTLTQPLSFVWLDLDFDILMEPVLGEIWRLLSPSTIIGIDDVGRPDTPSVEPWVDRLTAEGRLIELARFPGHQRFYRANMKWNDASARPS